MDIGLLWYDDDAQRPLAEKVARAVEHYRAQYGMAPTVCFVNPRMLPARKAPSLAAGVHLRPSPNVMVNHFWIGIGADVQTVAPARRSARAKRAA
jgi:hypothetical protein